MNETTQNLDVNEDSSEDLSPEQMAAYQRAQDSLSELSREERIDSLRFSQSVFAETGETVDGSVTGVVIPDVLALWAAEEIDRLDAEITRLSGLIDTQAGC